MLKAQWIVVREIRVERVEASAGFRPELRLFRPQRLLVYGSCWDYTPWKGNSGRSVFFFFKSDGKT